MVVRELCFTPCNVGLRILDTQPSIQPLGCVSMGKRRSVHHITALVDRGIYDESKLEARRKFLLANSVPQLKSWLSCLSILCQILVNMMCRMAVATKKWPSTERLVNQIDKILESLRKWNARVEAEAKLKEEERAAQLKEEERARCQRIIDEGEAVAQFLLARRANSCS